MDPETTPCIEDLSEPERPPTDPQRIVEINQLILNKGRRALGAKGRVTPGLFSKKNRRSNSHCSNKTTASTVTVLSKHSIPPDFLKSRDLTGTGSDLEDARAPKALTQNPGKLKQFPSDKKVSEKTQLESVMEVS